MSNTETGFSFEMVHEKSTGGTHVYSPTTNKNKGIIPALYIKKSGLPDDPPRAITITVDFGEPAEEQTDEEV